MDSGYIGMLVVAILIALIVSLLSPGKSFKCRKCGFTTSDPLRASGHVATENKHACEEC